jgi:nucleoside-diphosphate-sugar epimerase
MSLHLRKIKLTIIFHSWGMECSTSTRLLITGAGGFVGAAVVRAALVAGHEPIALVRTAAAPRLTGLPIARHPVDLSDTDRVAALLAELRPDVLIHCAWEGVGGPLRAGDVQYENIRTTCALVDAAIAAGVRKVIGIGSQAEYGRFDRRITEDDVPNPTMIYGAAKLAASHLARQRCWEADVGFAWMRLFSVYGPGDNPNWLIPSVTARIVAGQAPKTTAGTQKWDYLHVEDVASAILATALRDAATGVLNLSSGSPVAVRTIIECIRDLANPGLALRFGEIPFGPNQIMHLEGDNSRLIAATGWRPTIGLEDGLAAMVSALREAA